MPRLLFLISVTLLALTSCAKRGSITGGLKDTIPPVLRQSMPPNYSTEFKGNTIRLTFDEYVKLKDINKQLIISPPADRQPIITPPTASKTINIRLMDTLQPNTTYSLNFGQSIQDNNESNPYPQFKYVFSTGAYIDSLMLAGRIKDAYNKDADNFVSVMLYEVDENYTDSIIYYKTPGYITNTLDSAKVWQLENLKAGKYLLVALKDNNNNNIYNPKSDKIGFQSEFITLPTDTLYELELFKETPVFKTAKPSQASGNRMYVGYEGYPSDVTVKVSTGNQELESVLTKFDKADSLQVWFKPIKVDSLQVQVVKDDFNASYNVKIRDQKRDTLSFTPSTTGVLPLREFFRISSTIPIVQIDQTKILLQNKDSVAVSFETENDIYNQRVIFKFQREPEQGYDIRLLPGALTTFYQQQNDTLTYKLTTKKLSDYGNLRLRLQNVRQFPVIVQLTNQKGEVKAEAFSDEETLINFESIDPAAYTIRLIYDRNGNRRWDAGNFMQRSQSEEVIYFPEPIDIRANWDWEEPFILP